MPRRRPRPGREIRGREDPRTDRTFRSQALFLASDADNATDALANGILRRDPTALVARTGGARVVHTGRDFSVASGRGAGDHAAGVLRVLTDFFVLVRGADVFYANCPSDLSTFASNVRLLRRGTAAVDDASAGALGAACHRFAAPGA